MASTTQGREAVPHVPHSVGKSGFFVNGDFFEDEKCQLEKPCSDG